MKLALTAAATGVVAIVLCVLSPLRQVSGDTVPGRLGAAALRCGGDLDLSRVDWIKADIDRDAWWYYLYQDETGEFASVFGPAPALFGSLFLLDFGDNDWLDDDTFRRRERDASAVLLAIAVALITVAAARTSVVRGALVGAACALSFAGCATLGQGLWQATTAMPFLAGALALLAWRERIPRVWLATPAVLVIVVMLRPTIAPLVLGVGLSWATDAKDRRTWLIATGLALAVAVPFVIYNAIHWWSPLPIGQWHANQRVTNAMFTVRHAAVGLSGLLVSPARGLVIFAPLAIVGAIAALRSGPRAQRLLAVGVVLQVLVMATFHMWHGGQSYGPRFLSEAAWVGIVLAIGAGVTVRRAVLAPAIAITIVVGQLGLWRWVPEQWESRLHPDANMAVLWNVRDSPIIATLTNPRAGFLRAYDSPPMPGIRCVAGKLVTKR